MTVVTHYCDFKCKEVFVWFVYLEAVLQFMSSHPLQFFFLYSSVSGQFLATVCTFIFTSLPSLCLAHPAERPG